MLKSFQKNVFEAESIMENVAQKGRIVSHEYEPHWTEYEAWILLPQNMVQWRNDVSIAMNNQVQYRGTGGGVFP